VSGKVWKDGASKRASADKNSIIGSSWEKKMREKVGGGAQLDERDASKCQHEK
jgi:hypothetical protein